MVSTNERWVARHLHDWLVKRLKRNSYLIVKPTFYSPMVDKEALAADAERMWPNIIADCAGIDFNEAGHRALIAGDLPQLAGAFDYPSTGAADDELQEFYECNSPFEGTDARVLFGLLRLWRPQRIIEIGSGYSTLLMDDVNRRFLDGQVKQNNTVGRVERSDTHAFAMSSHGGYRRSLTHPRKV